MTLSTTALWFYTLMASVVFGATVYEALVVHPAWSRKPPESFAGFMGAAISRMNLGGFWVPVVPLYALSGLVAFAVALRAGNQRAPLALSAACAVAAVGWTLAYFRPTIERFLERGGRRGSGRTIEVRGPTVDPAQLDPFGDGRGLLVGGPDRAGDSQLKLPERAGR